MKVTGIDPSLTGTGIANGTGALTVRKLSGDDRLLDIYQHVRTYVRDVDLVVMEDLPTHAHGAGKTGMAQGVARLALLHEQVRYVTVVASTLKKFATGKGNATKPDMRMELFKRTGVDLKDDNQVDATWLWHLGLHLLGEPAVELPKAHLVALEKVAFKMGFEDGLKEGAVVPGAAG